MPKLIFKAPRGTFAAPCRHRTHGLTEIHESVFDMSVSRGSVLPAGYTAEDDGQEPADVVPHEAARLFNARQMAQTQKVRTNYEPWEEGNLSASYGMSINDNPYDPASSEYDEWMDGFRS